MYLLLHLHWGLPLPCNSRTFNVILSCPFLSGFSSICVGGRDSEMGWPPLQVERVDQ